MKPSRQTLLVFVALTGLTLAGFFPVFSAGFITYDDPFYITNNPPVRDGLSWAGAQWAFTTLYFCNWHPITWLSHMLDCHLFGLNAAGHHAITLLLHLLNGILLFKLLRGLTGAVWRSAFVAAFFAVHPLHVESVAWVAERKDVLSMFFGLLTLLAYVRYVRGSESHPAPLAGAATGSQRPRIWYLAALLLFALGLMSKPMLVTLPCLMLLLDFWPLQRVPGFRCGGSGEDATDRDLTPDPRHLAPALRRLFLEKVPFFLMVAGSCVVTVIAQAKAGSVATVDYISFGQRLANSLVAYGWYVGKLFWPVDLAVIYPLFPSVPVERIIAATGIMLMFTALAFWQRRRRPYLLIGWLWFVGTLVPVIGLVQVGMQAYADRYTYLPYIGLFIALAWLGAEFAGDSEARRRTLGTLAMVALGLCTVATNRQTRYWKDAVTVWTRAVNVTQDNYLAQNHLGYALAERGEYSQAIEHYLAATRITPRFGDAFNNLGYAYLRQNRLELALPAFREAARLKPNDARVLHNLAAALHDSGDYTNAIAEYLATVWLDPQYEEAHYNLANSYAAAGEVTNALASYERAIALRPDYAAAHLNRGHELLRLGRSAEARASFEHALQSRTNFAAAHYALGLVAASEAEALQAYETALGLKPDYPEALNNLAWLLATSPDAQHRNGPRAVELAGRACELTQNKLPIFVGTLAAAYAEAGRFPEALKAGEQAAQLAAAAGDAALAARNRELIALYQTGKPFRQPP